MHELICFIQLSSGFDVHILMLLVPCRSSFKMKIPLNLINGIITLRICLTDMSFCALRVLLSVVAAATLGSSFSV